MDTFISGYEDKLLAARQTIEGELNEGLAPFTAQIDGLHESYLATFKLYLKNCYAEGTAEYTAKVDDYELELGEARTKALENFATAVANAMVRIETFHAKIITR